MIRLAIIGARGIPAKYGGFETFAEELSVNLVEKHGYDILVVSDADQKEKNKGMTEYKGVKIAYSKYPKQGNALKFYYDSLKIAKGYPIIYSCGPGVGTCAWLARKNGNILITNTDGLNWKRAKWSPLVQRGFKMFEWLSCKFSHYISCDSYGIEDYVKKVYKHPNTFVAEYGSYENPFIGKPHDTAVTAAMRKYGLQPNAYHLVVSRLEPENNVLPIIEGYVKEERKYPLAVVGNLNDGKFCQQLKAAANDKVLFLNGIYNKDELSIVRAMAVSYFHGHSVGGTNPSLLEALGSRNLCVCHDNPFNREVTDNQSLYFDSAIKVDEQVRHIESGRNDAELESMRDKAMHRVRTYYNWDNITDKYHRAFLDIAKAKQLI